MLLTTCALSAVLPLQDVKVLQEETTQEENRYNQITSMTEASREHGDEKLELLWVLRQETQPLFLFRQTVKMQLQRAADEMKIYVSSDPQEKKKALR